MKLVREKSIREKVDVPTNRMIDFWHKLCNENYKETYEILLANRYEHPQLKDFKGELYTAYPGVVNGNKVIVIYVEQLKNVEFIFITHELGHLILYLLNFYTYTYTKENNSDIEILINSMCHHSPLYNLQRTLGHEPQNNIDERTKHNIKIFSESTERKVENLWKLNALILSDDIINCSEFLKEELKNVASQNHPNTFKFINMILDLIPYFDLIKPHKNIRFTKKVLDILNFDRGWWEIKNNKESLRRRFSEHIILET